MAKRRADDLERAVVGLVARDDEEAGVLHLPVGLEEFQAGREPVDVLRGAEEDAGRARRLLEVPRERRAHRAEDHRGDRAALGHERVDIVPAVVEVHAGQQDAVDGRGLELLNEGVDLGQRGDRLRDDLQRHAELLGGLGERLGVELLVAGNVVRGAGPTHPVFLDARMHEGRPDRRPLGGLGLFSEDRRGEIEHADLHGQGRDARGGQELAPADHEGTQRRGTWFVGLHAPPP